ncbi:MAG: MFS transporter [Acidobacteriota bacterium]
MSLGRAMASWRTASVVLLSFSSGLPLGLVWIAIPDWMRSAGVDIRVVGLITLAQAPWSFKVLWSPLMDRYHPPRLGRRRGWALAAQLLLFTLLLCLAGLGHHPDTPWVVAALAFAIAFASASQDIAVDAYAVEVLRPAEQGMAVGARIAVYRAAMYVAGGLSITLAGQFSWPWVNAGLAVLFLPMMAITRLAPAPEHTLSPPRTLREAVWHPFLGFLARDRALEILAFVFFYKIADNLAQALLRPFLVDMGYSDFDRGVALSTVGLVSTLAGTFLGGLLTTAMGLGHSLWAFGCVQILSNLGYVLVARGGGDRLLMYGATGFENFTSGLGTGAFSVLLLRMTQKRFSATQYALFSSLFSLPRIVSGPISGFTVHAVGWEPFFWGTMLAGVPGMILLQRFAPLGVREPHFTTTLPVRHETLSSAAVVARGLAAGLLGLAGAGLGSAALSALAKLYQEPGSSLDLRGSLAALLHPGDAVGWLHLAGLILLAGVVGLVAAAVAAARHGGGADLGSDDSGS